MTHQQGAPVRWGLTVTAIAACLGSWGCASAIKVDKEVAVGDYGAARQKLAEHGEDKPGNRHYILDKMRLTMTSLADGYPDSAELATNEMFELLRTQGINEDKTVLAAVTVENVLIWKGEPFEQAMAFYYVALQKAMRGEWDNARAAAAASLFLLRDFGENEKGERLSTEEIATISVEQDRQRSQEGEDAQEYIDHGYQPIKTNFALGYLMNGVANYAMGRDDEARDNFHEAVNLNAGLQDVTTKILSGRTNTLLFVEYGQGPRKVRYGMDNAFSRFEPRTPSIAAPLRVTVDGGPQQAFGPACDVNTMAMDHMWNNMQDVRVAKSYIGTALIAGAVAVSAGSSSEGAQYAALAMAIAGLLMKASAAADITYCDLLPQSVYLAPLYLSAADASIDLIVGDDPNSRLVLNGADPPGAHERFRVLYARLAPSAAPLPWAATDEILYCNDEFDGPYPEPQLPYILGGRCVRIPTYDVLEAYREAGFLQDMSLVDLENLYREEGIYFTVEDQGGIAGRHILEGGNSLVCPEPGSVGYERIFGQMHEPYRPKSDNCKALAARIATQLASQETVTAVQ